MNSLEKTISREEMLLLADKYESAAFLEKDPSQFMHRFSSVKDIETVAFIAANLAFGRREQILSHVQMILDQAGASPSKWILSGAYRSFFPESDKSFYRMFSFKTMRLFLDTIRSILQKKETLGDFFRDEFLLPDREKQGLFLSKVIASSFPKDCTIIPHGKTSADKRLQMFLRWMVRDSSPVDMGLWKWHKKSDLLLPLDTHVMQEATEMGFLKPSSSGKSRAATLKTAVELTDRMRFYFGDDPARADFALFGLGVDKGASKSLR